MKSRSTSNKECVLFSSRLSLTKQVNFEEDLTTAQAQTTPTLPFLYEDTGRGLLGSLSLSLAKEPTFIMHFLLCIKQMPAE